MIWRHLLRIFLLAIGQGVGSLVALNLASSSYTSLIPDLGILWIPFAIFFFPLIALDSVGIGLHKGIYRGIEDTYRSIVPREIDLTWVAINNLLWVLIVYAVWLLIVRLRQSSPTASVDESVG